MERLSKVKERHLCFNCLKRGHRVGHCRSRMCTVSGCGKKHHTLLHQEEAPPSQKLIPEEKVSESKKEVAVSQLGSSISNVSCSSVLMAAHHEKKQVILSTAIVQVKNFKEMYHPCRVLLDSGSQSNFLSEHIVNVLRLKREAVQIPIVGINGEKLVVTHQTAARVKSIKKRLGLSNSSSYHRSPAPSQLINWIHVNGIFPQIYGLPIRDSTYQLEWTCLSELNSFLSCY